MERIDPFSSDELMREIFSYHAPSHSQLEKYRAVREAALKFAQILGSNVPACADRAAALRKLREIVMTANAGIALEGKV